eukprot:TRINITY_DN15896_c0_g1_i1.p2 TRINITY_DN15896_c0_g1~~TRINITY_DN15896_c0_g1_i1.p2  ORF type:complete len:104 (+),score=15.08 TRINITY_DN15896_c0_g1_i1:43-354(+)
MSKLSLSLTGSGGASSADVEALISSYFDLLPVEIIRAILFYVSDNDAFMLSQTCKVLQQLKWMDCNQRDCQHPLEAHETTWFAWYHLMPADPSKALQPSSLIP